MITDLKTYLVDNGLSILDKTTMATSLEGRVPYLQKDLVQTLFSLDETIYLSDQYSKSKPLLKKIALENSLSKLIQRKKSGFNQPLEGILENKKHREKIQNEINKAKTVLERYIDIEKVGNDIINNCSIYNSENILNIFILAKWCNKYKKNICFQ